MKALETVYNGYRFRSRLEARWAVFFETMGIRFVYEKQGYDLDDLGWYLPDFFLPEVNDGLWVEVKGDKADVERADNQINCVCAITARNGIVVLGDPFSMVERAVNYNFDLAESGESYTMHFGGADCDWPYVFCVCPRCQKVGVHFEGRGDRVCGKKCTGDDDKGYTYDHPGIVNAAVAARQARFDRRPVVA